MITDCLGNLLRVDRFATGLANREPIELLARLAVMFRCTVEMDAVARFLDEPRDCDSSWELVEFGPLHNRHRHGLDPFPQF